SLSDLRRQVVVVDLEVVGHLREPYDDPEVMRDLEPRRHVAVVVEPRDDDLVTAVERSRKRSREEEVERGHAGPERDLLGRATEKVGCTLTSTQDECVGA